MKKMKKLVIFIFLLIGCNTISSRQDKEIEYTLNENEERKIVEASTKYDEIFNKLNKEEKEVMEKVLLKNPHKAIYEFNGPTKELENVLNKFKEIDLKISNIKGLFEIKLIKVFNKSKKFPYIVLNNFSDKINLIIFDIRKKRFVNVLSIDKKGITSDGINIVNNDVSLNELGLDFDFYQFDREENNIIGYINYLTEVKVPKIPIENTKEYTNFDWFVLPHKANFYLVLLDTKNSSIKKQIIKSSNNLNFNAGLQLDIGGTSGNVSFFPLISYFIHNQIINHISSDEVNKNTLKNLIDDMHKNCLDLTNEAFDYLVEAISLIKNKQIDLLDTINKNDTNYYNAQNIYSNYIMIKDINILFERLNYNSFYAEKELNEKEERKIINDSINLASKLQVLGMGKVFYNRSFVKSSLGYIIKSIKNIRNLFR